MFHFVEFKNVKYLLVLIHQLMPNSEFQGAFALSFERNNSKIAHLSEMVAILEMLLHTEADDALTYVSNKTEQLLKHYRIKRITDLS